MKAKKLKPLLRDKVKALLLQGKCGVISASEILALIDEDNKKKAEMIDNAIKGWEEIPFAHKYYVILELANLKVKFNLGPREEAKQRATVNIP